MLASIAHRTPPRALRALGAGRLDPRRGAGRPRSRRHAVRDRRLPDPAHGCTPRRRPGTRRTRPSTPRCASALHIAAVFERAGEFDVISQPVRLPAADVTAGSTRTPGGHDDPRVLLRADRAGLPRLRRHRALRRRSATPTGTPPSPTPRRSTTASTSTQFTPGTGDGGYLLFLGRIHPDKGTHRRDRGRPPRRACRSSSPASCRTTPTSGRSSRRTSTATACASSGPSARRERDRAARRRRALLHLIDFAEPFGLSVVESLAAGTPVIATPRGSMPELVRDGVTGLPRGRRRPARSPPSVGCRRSTGAACRREAETRFTADRMVDDYELSRRRAGRRVACHPSRRYRARAPQPGAEPTAREDSDMGSTILQRGRVRAGAVATAAVLVVALASPATAGDGHGRGHGTGRTTTSSPSWAPRTCTATP